MEKECGRKPDPRTAFRFGKGIQMVGNLFRRLADENLSKHHINISQLRILGYLSQNQGRGEVFQKDLEEAFGVRRSSVTSILQNMEKSGYLERSGSAEDARVKKVVLTEKGKQLDDQLKSFIHNLENEMLKGILEEEKALLQTLLEKMLLNLEEIERGKV